MKSKIKNITVRGLSLAMASTMVAAFIAANVELATGSSVQAAVSSGLTDVTGKVDTDKLRAQYYNDGVQENTMKSDDERWVIVNLEGDSVLDAYQKNGVAGEYSDYANTTAAKNRLRSLERSHDSFLTALNAKGISFQYKYSYTAVENAVAIKVKGKDIAAIGKMSGVESVSASVTYSFPTAAAASGTGAVSNNANVYATGIYNSSDLAYKGEGMVVAVLDTGLDFSHQAFQTKPSDLSKLGITEDQIKDYFSGGENPLHASARTPGMSYNQVFYGEKVPFAYDYADDDPDVFPSYSSHGTHVAGIVAGQDDSKQVNPEDPSETFIGVAPEAQLVICKVFTDDLDSQMIGGADAVDILAALEDCVTLGVDVINMSLGTSAGFTSEEGLQEGDFLVESVYEKIENSGISLVVAASNDYSSGYGGGNGTNLTSNPDSGTVGSPSTYAAALSVASINGQNSRYMVANRNAGGDVAFYTEASDVNGESLDFIKGIYEKTKTDKTQELTLDYVVVGGVGRPANYTTTVRRALQNGNTIALVKRGDINFAEKVQNAMDNGALGVIIYNNLSGNIRMSLGDVKDPIPTCSIGMDAGKKLVDGATRGVGTLTFNYSYSAGPFMSDFSSWGPTPDLQLKPEITAHGGEITSAVPGGYDEYSGTSMAAPNMSGAVALLRQHVESSGMFDHLSGAEKAKAIRTHANQILMSTATMALNEEGNPYSPRKQGAGLAGIKDAIETESYLTVSDGKGGVLDKTKIELGDDKEKKGVYQLKFTVNNFSAVTAEYKPAAYVFTETVSSDEKTVAEKAYMLNDYSTIEVQADGKTIQAGGTFSVSAGQKVEVIVTITLNDEAKKYLNDNFENGMFVEGFVRLEKAGSTKVSLGIPYLAFYGDWTAAPLFDYSMYEIAESEKNAVEEEDKLKASAADTRPLGIYNDDQYIIPLGSYLYDLDEFDTDIYASEEKAAVSCYDEQGRRTIYEFYMIYAGLLRGAKTMQVDVTDAVTGELIYSKLEKNVRKSYAAGGSNRGAPILLEMNPIEWGMSNNTRYNLTMSGAIDYKRGESVANNTFSCSFTVDTQAPVIRDYRIRFEPYTEDKETKYRIYMDVDVYDNQFAMDVLPCYIKDNTLTLITQYPVPVYGERGAQSTVSFEITDYYEEYVKKGDSSSENEGLYLAVEDYAMNQSVYRVSPLAASDYPDKVTFVTDDKLTLESEGNYNTYKLQIAHNEVYKLSMSAIPEDTVAASLEWNVLRESVAKAKGNEIFGSGSGSTTINLRDNGTDRKIKARINLTVTGSVAEPLTERLVFEPILNGKDYLVNPNNGDVELNPNQTVQFAVEEEPWYSTVEQLKWSSSNENVFTVDQEGKVTTKRKGSAYLQVQAVGYDRLTKSVKIVVGDEYDVNNYTLYHYYGGPIADIPDEKNIMYLSEDAFRGNTVVEEIILPNTLTEIPEGAFSGCVNLKKVTFPAKCNIIGNYAFSLIIDNNRTYEACKNLETIIFEKPVDEITGEETDGTITVGKYAFAGCEKLKTIQHSKRITTANEGAFYLCAALEEIDITGLRIVGNSVFEECTSLARVQTSPDTYIGNYMFAGCTSLQSFAFKSRRLSDYAFYNCANLNSITFENDLYYFGAGAFGGDRSQAYGDRRNNKLTSITLPNGTYKIGAQAFLNCIALEKVVLSANTVIDLGSEDVFRNCTAFTAFDAATSGNAHYSSNDGVLYSADGTTVIAVPVAKTGVTLLSSATKIGAGAFAGNRDAAFTIPATVTEIGAYAFAGSSIKNVNLSGLNSVPEGAFSGCSLDSVTGWSGIQKIGAYAFCNALDRRAQTLDLSAATEIGDYAFAGCTFVQNAVNAANVTKIGAHAFDGADLRGEVDFSGVTELGDYAFAQNLNMKKITLGGVTKMGVGVFSVTSKNVNLMKPALQEVIFGEGTTEIGDNAFEFIYVSSSISADYEEYETREYSDRTSLTKVVIPASVTKIGEYAFVLCSSLKSDDMDLVNVKTVSGYAFIGCEELETLNLTSVETIGDEAFGLTTKLTDANLPKAKTIGAYAFAGGGLSDLSIPSAEVIGTLAFTGTNLTSVTVPNQTQLTYEEERTKVSESGRVEPAPGKHALRYASGMLSDIPTLTEIKVEGEGKFLSIDGVLYSQAKNGLVLEQYPAAKQGESYTIAANTVRIGDFSFANTRNLRSVVIPYTVESIGSQAFFNNLTGDKFVKDYTFEGVEAPVLEGAYSMDSALSQEAYAQGIYYSNFRGYVATIFSDVTRLEGVQKSFGLTITRPENGVGYDSPIWKAFFAKENLSEYAPTRVTRKTIDLIAALPSAEEIRAVATAEDITAMSVNRVQPARISYNLIKEERQRAFVTNYNDLLGAEQAVREVKAALGIPTVMTELAMASRPDKISYYDGERFDPTGMVIKAIYDDLSEIIVTDYTLNVDVLHVGESAAVTVVISYNGLSCSIDVAVSYPPEPTEEDGLSVGAIVGIVIGSVLGAGAIAAGVVLFLLYRKKKANAGAEQASDETAEPQAQETETSAQSAEAEQEDKTKSQEENKE